MYDEVNDHGESEDYADTDQDIRFDIKVQRNPIDFLFENRVLKVIMSIILEQVDYFIAF